MPAATAATRTFGAHSTARLCASETSPAFAAPYAAVPGDGLSPETLVMKTITPPSGCFCIAAFARCAQWSGATRFSWMIFSWKRGEAVAASVAGAPPALATSTSRRPKRARVSAKRRSICSASRTSAGKKDASLPPALGSESGSARPQIATSAPAARKRSAMPRPTPRLPPVTSATLPAKSSVIMTSLASGSLRASLSLVEPDALRHLLAVPGGVTEQGGARARSLQIELDVVVVGEADAAGDLERVGGAGERGLGGRRLRGRGGEREVLRFGVGGDAAGPVDRGPCGLELHHHVGALVLDRLEGADRAAELDALLGIGDGEVERALRDADLLGRERDGGEREGAGQRGLGGGA